MVVPTSEFRRAALRLALMFLTGTEYFFSAGKVLEDHTFGVILWEGVFTVMLLTGFDLQ